MTPEITRGPSVQEAFERAPVGLVVAALDGTVVRTNRAFLRALQVDEADLAGLHYTALVHPEDRARERELFGSLVAGAQDSYEMEERVLTGSGAYRWMQVHVTLLPSRDFPAGHVMAALLDIEDRKAPPLTGAVAHAFDTLLTVIRGELELLLHETPCACPESSHIRTAIEATDQAEWLTRNLLAVGRQQFLRPEFVDINDLVGQGAGVLHGLIPEGIQLVVDLAASVPPVRVDPVQVFQVIRNLVLNARDASRSGDTIRLRTFVRTATKGAEQVVLQVQDEGCGMSRAVLAHAFEPFYSTKPNGTGLGLSASQSTVSQCGGSMEVWTRPGAGTVFQVALPVVSRADPGSSRDPQREVL